jgi:small GTP-binding protein
MVNSNIYASLYKILIVGDINTGKTSILDQFTNGNFDGAYISTIGIDFNVKMVNIDEDTKVKLQIWDTCGQERFRALTRSYYRNANAIIIVYDITSRKSFENAKIWIKEFEQYLDPGVLPILVGNKTDLFLYRQIQYFEGYNLAQEKYMEYFETSAKYDNNIETLFTFIAHKLYDNTKQKEKEKSKLLLKEKKRTKCC